MCFICIYGSFFLREDKEYLLTHNLEGFVREFRDEVDENAVTERILRAVQLLSARQDASKRSTEARQAALWALEEHAKNTDKKELTNAFSKHFGTLLLDADVAVQNSKGILDLNEYLKMLTWSPKELATLRGYRKRSGVLVTNRINLCIHLSINVRIYPSIIFLFVHYQMYTK